MAAITEAGRSNGVGEDAAAQRWAAEVIVMPKEGVSDPEGEAILGGLRGLGYDAVRSVRAGRLFRVELVATDRAMARAAVEEMCQRLLANPVIERYDVRLEESPPRDDDRVPPAAGEANP